MNDRKTLSKILDGILVVAVLGILAWVMWP